MVKGLGKRLWLRCDICAHTVMVEPEAFAASHGLVMLTPLLSMDQRLRFTERRGLARIVGRVPFMLVAL